MLRSLSNGGPGRFAALWAAVLWLAGGCHGCSPAPEALPTLTLGESVESDLAKGEVDEYEIELELSDYLYLEAEQEGLNLKLRLFDARGKQVLEIDNYLGVSGAEALSWIAESSGAHRLRVEALAVEGDSGFERARGRYELTIEKLREARQADKVRQRAEVLYLEGDRLSQYPDERSRLQAIGKYEEALALMGEIAAPELESLLLTSIGLVLSPLGKGDAAIRYYERSLAICRAMGDRKNEADNLFNIGQALERAGEARSSLSYFDDALEIYRKLGDANGETMALDHLGAAYGTLGEVDEALRLHEASLARSREVGGQRRDAYTYNRLGLLYTASGEYQKALDAFQSAASRFSASHNLAGLAGVFNGRGVVFRRLGDLEAALESYERSLEINRERGDVADIASVLGNIGFLREKQGNCEQSLETQAQALGLFREVSSRGAEATTLENMARCHAALGRHDEALDLLDDALEIRLDTGDRLGETYALQSFGHTYEHMGELETAQDYFERSLVPARYVGDGRSISFSLYRLARVEKKLGRLESAKAHLEEALEISERVRTQVVSQDLRSTYLASNRMRYELYVEVLMALDELDPRAGYAAAALVASEDARARGLRELLTEARVEVEGGISAALRHRERESLERLSHLQSRLIEERAGEGATAAQLAALRAQLEEQEAARAEIEEQIRREHPRYASLQYPRSLSLGEVQALLAPGEALLEYALGEEISTLFVITREGLETHRLPAEAAIAAAVETLRGVLERPGRRDLGRFRHAAFELYETLVAPAEETLARKLRLIVVPDGVLYYLTFESLLTGPGVGLGYRELPFLLERWPVSYVPSATVLASLAEEGPARGGAAGPTFVGVGDPVYDALSTSGEVSGAPAAGWEPLRDLFPAGGRGLVRLVDSSTEVRRIADLFGLAESAVYLREQASEARLKHSPKLAAARYLHFATHGLLSEKSPRYSGLVLTLGGDSGEDGLFQVYEIFNLELEAELVVLSACRSGLGKEVRGEGLIGLTRAFLYAGAPSVVVSLWQVADRSTAELMVRFYGHLAAGEAKTEALRRAKLELLAEGRFHHPYYWAPFVLVGRP